MKKNIIMLFEIRSVGKTTVRKLLSEKLNYKFFDLYDVIEKYYDTASEEYQYSTTFPHG